MHNLSLTEFIAEADKGTIFTVEFVKRTTGELRKMNCRKGVKKDIKGTGMSYSPLERGLLPVFDLQKETELGEKGAYRLINLQELKSLRMKGKRYTYDPDARMFIEE